MNDIILLIFTCKDYLSTRAQWQRNTWLDSISGKGVKYHFVVGEPTLKTEFKTQGDILWVKNGDKYEDFLAKTMAAFRYALKMYPNARGFFKIDDDVYVNPLHWDRVISIITNTDYSGQLVTTVPPAGYHINKVSDTKFKVPIATPYFGNYCAGAAYYASTKAISAYIEFADRYPSFMNTYMLEDKCLGDVLRICGINKEHYVPDYIGNWWDLKQKYEITQCFCYSELRTEADYNTLHKRLKHLQPAYDGVDLIPKTIHFFWEGSDELPAKVQRVINTWKETNPDYVIKRWSYKDLPDHPLLKEMYDKKLWSPLSDFARAYCIVKDGGFYFDTDLELTKSLNDLRNLRCFSSVEGLPVKLNNAACGGLPESPFMQLVLDRFLNTPIPKQVGLDPIPVVYGPGNVSRTFEAKYGKLMKWHMERIFIYPDLITLPRRFFYPYNWNEKFTEDCLKPDTHGIHLWEKSW